MQRSDTIGELAKALAAAQAEFTPVPKSGFNPHFKSHYAELGDLTGMATPILNKHGLAVSQWPESQETSEGRIDVLTTLLLHSSGEFLEGSMPLYLGAQKTSQSQGSAVTYDRRYTYGAALGIVTDDDDDGNAASQQARPSPARSSAGRNPSTPTAVTSAAAKPPTDDQDKENALGLLKNAVDKGWIERGPANELWSHYNEVGFKEFCDRLERIVSQRTQTASAPERPKSATVVSLEERVAQVQANQRVRPAPMEDK